jgi:hypothetical protein
MSRFFYAFVIILITIFVIFSGCIHSKIETDLFAAKIDSEGKLAWVQIIDSGQNDEGINLTEKSDGSYLIAGGSYQSICGTRHYGPTTPYEIHLSSNGKIDSMINFSGMPYENNVRSESLNNTGWSSFTSDDGSHLITYQNVKGSALYFRLQKTDAKGNSLWDTPFLTLKYRSAPKETWETVFIHEIHPTSDNGYIVWGHRERSTTC